jgi:hypothetical protein
MVGLMIETPSTNESPRWRFKALSVCIVLSLLALATMLLVVGTAPRVSANSGWWDINWTRRRSITITGNHPENYQIKIAISYDSDMRSDYGDLRFLENETAGVLSYWIENYTVDNVTIWVRRVENSDNTIYVYYGNPSATNAGNENAVFDYIDRGNQVASWTVVGSSGQSGVEGNPAPSYYAVSTNGSYIYRNINLVPGRILTFNVKSNGLGNLFFLVNSSGAGQMYRLDSRGGQWSGFATTSSWTSWTAPSSGFNAATNVWYKLTIVITSPTSATLYYKQTTDSSPSDFGTLLGAYTITNNGGFIGLVGDALGSAYTTWWDSIIVRKYTSPEPSCTIGAEEVVSPSQPQLQQPGNNSYTNDNTPVLRWSVGQNADNHRLLVDNDPNFTSPEDNVLIGASDNTWTKPAPGYRDGTYSWKVIAIKGALENSSPVWTFLIDTVTPGTPAKSAPADGTKTNDSTPTFTWSATTDDSSGVKCYEVWIDDDPNFTSPERLENTADNITTSYTPTALADENYSWRVRAWDWVGNPGSFESPWTVLIDTIPPAAPPLISPADGENLNDNTPLLDWSTIIENSLPVLYRCYIDDNPGFTSIDRDSGWIAADQWEVTPALHEGIWYLRVRAMDNAGNIGGNSVTRSFRVAIPSKPQPQQPGNNSSTNDNTPIFRWSVGQNTENHRLIVGNDPNFADGDNSIDITLGATTNNYTTPDENSLADGKYYWKVVAINPQGENSSDEWNFIVDKTPPLAPYLDSPDNNENMDDNLVIFIWMATADNISKTLNVSNIANYELWLDNDSDFTSPLVTENTSDDSTLSLTKEVAGKLYWRVRAWDRAGNAGAFSETRFLTVFNFSLNASSTTVQMMRGSSCSVILSINRVFGEIENVELNFEWVGILPSSVTVDFDPQKSPVSFTSTLNSVSSPSATTGTFTCRVNATSESGIKRTIDIQITVYGMLFSVTAFPRTISLMRSDTSTVLVSVEFDQGALENVFLSGSWVGETPTGVSARFNPNSGTPPYDSTLTMTTTGSAGGGSFIYRISSTGSGLTRKVDLNVSILTYLTITLTTDRSFYEKGQKIWISGTAKDPKGNPVENGQATITLKSGKWSDQLVSQITDGTYAESYYITFDKPEGDWSISASAVDNRGNLGQSSENVIVAVSIPAAWKYYTVTFLSPVPGTVCLRGSEVTVTVQLTEGAEKISGADIYLATSSGGIITLTEGSPGIYSITYFLKWDDPVGEWTLSILGEKTVQGVYKGGTGSTSVNIAPANLKLELLEPSQRTFKVGDEMGVKVRISYPDGSPVDGAIAIVDSFNGENLALTNDGEGVYKGTYSVSSRDIGTWGLTVSAVDAYGNSGTSSEVTLSFEELSPSGYPIRYWWITIPVAIACAIASTPSVVKKLRVRKLRSINSEIRATEKLRSELPERYFVKGGMPRETYDSLMHQSLEKLIKLKNEARKLKKILYKRDLT